MKTTSDDWDPRAESVLTNPLASYDELTGHFNRSRLRQAVEQALTASR